MEKNLRKITVKQLKGRIANNGFTCRGLHCTKDCIFDQPNHCGAVPSKIDWKTVTNTSFGKKRILHIDDFVPYFINGTTLKDYTRIYTKNNEN